MAYSGLLTKSSIESRRRMAEQLLGQVAEGGPARGGWGEGIARALQGVGAGLMMRNANNEERARYDSIQKALSSGMTPDEMRNFGVVNEMSELIDMADRTEDRKWRQEDRDWRRQEDAEDDAWRQKEFDADEAYRNRPGEPKRYEVGNNLVDEGGNVVYEGQPKPHKLTESEIKGKSIETGAQHHADVLFAGATPDNPVPGLDELASWQNTLGRRTESFGGGAIMSGKAQVTIDALRGLAQQYIYALSGQQAPESEVQRIVGLVLPGATDKADRVLEKKREIANMYETIKARAAPAIGGEPESMGDAGGTMFGEVGEIPEGAVVEDETGAQYRKENGTLVPVQ